MGDMWKEASIGFKIQIIFFVVMAIFFAYIGLQYLTGNLQVQSSPEPTTTTSNYDCYYSESMGDYYCPDPPEQDLNEFPARP